MKRFRPASIDSSEIKEAKIKLEKNYSLHKFNNTDIDLEKKQKDLENLSFLQLKLYQYLDNLIRSKYSSSNGALNFAYIAYKKREYKLALKHIDKDIANSNYSYSSIFFRTFIKIMLGQSDSKADCFLCVKINPISFEAYLLKGFYYTTFKEYEMAFRTFNEASKLSLKKIPDYEIANYAVNELRNYLRLKSKSEINMNGIGYTWIDKLPVELLLIIFSYVELKYLCVATLVCKRWNQSLKNIPFLWESLYFDFATKAEFSKKKLSESGTHYAISAISRHLSRAKEQLRLLSIKNSPKLDYRYFKGLIEVHRPILRSIELINTKVNNIVIMPILRRYTSITKLVLSNCDLDYILVRSIFEKMPNICYLDISNNPDLNNSIFFNENNKQIGPLRGIKHLNVSRLSFKLTFIKLISEIFPELLSLNLSYIKGLTIENLDQIIYLPKSLTKIEIIQANIKKSEERLALNPLYALGRKLDSKLSLNLSNNSFIGDHAILYFFGLFQGEMIELDLSQTSITFNGLRIITHHLPNLQKLYISGCPHIDDKALYLLFDQHSVCKTTLTHLNISKLTLHDKTVIDLTNNLPLNWLNLSTCPNVTENGLLPIFDVKTNLYFINLEYCSQIRPEFIRKVRALQPKMEISYAVNLN